MEPQKFNSDFKPKIILGIAAHPDDLDFGASGSFARWVSEGAECYYLILTDGSKGSSDLKMTSEELIKIRRDEQKNAAKILGLKEVFFLDYEDSKLENTIPLRRDVAKHIRLVKPEVVVTMDPSVIYANNGFINHPDHRAASQAALDAVFPLARDRLTFPELIVEGYEPHKVGTVLMTNFNHSNFFVDISSTIDKKMLALAAHDSQMPDIKAIQERMKNFAEKLGEEINASYAEGFVRLDLPL